jgi:hypothetical protein
MRYLYIVMLLAMAAAVSARAGDAPAKDGDELIVSMRSAIQSGYVFRGQERNEKPVEQSAVVLDKGMFHLSLMGNMDLTDETENGGELTEVQVDTGLRHRVYQDAASKVLKGVDAFGGLLYYSYPENSRDATTELYAGIGVDTWKGLYAKATLFWDVDEADGVYTDLRLSRPTDLPWSFTLLKQTYATSITPEVGYGWGSESYNKYHWRVDDSAMADWHAGLSALARSEKIAFGPYVNYYELMDGEIQNRQNDSSNVVCGLLFDYTF